MSEQDQRIDDIFEEAGEEIAAEVAEETESCGETQAGSEEVTEAEEVEGEEAETEEEAEAAEDDAKPEKKSFFKKKKDKKDAQIEELNDKLRRQMAEFDNFRKRTEKEKAAMFDIGARSVIEKLLPIVDNFERGIAMRPEGEASTAFADGMDKIYRQMLSMLEALDVTPIEAVGKEFDPNFHNAVMQDEEADVPENTVVAEFQKGYMHHGTVIRYSMVRVRK